MENILLPPSFLCILLPLNNPSAYIFCSILSMQSALADFYDKSLMDFYHAGFLVRRYGSSLHQIVDHNLVNISPSNWLYGTQNVSSLPISSTLLINCLVFGKKIEPLSMLLAKSAQAISNGGIFSFLLPINHKFIRCIKVQPFGYFQVEGNGFSLSW